MKTLTAILMLIFGCGLIFLVGILLERLIKDGEREGIVKRGYIESEDDDEV